MTRGLIHARATHKTSEWKPEMKNAYHPDTETQREIYRRMALIKANDERSRKVIRTGTAFIGVFSQIFRGETQ